MRRIWFFTAVFSLLGPLYAERVTVPLDGTWQIDESVAAGAQPAGFAHSVPVPGLANLAVPPFADVDRFDSRELIHNRVWRKMLPESARIQTVGIPRQTRNYFWYRRAFRVPARKQVAILKINKAQFGTAVWLNGVKLGEHLGCFTAGYFDATKAVRWEGENDLVVRVGAHPAALPATVPAGTDFEKLKWTPGIYDSVTLQLADNPVIESIQVAPDIRTSSILVETVIRNYGAAAKTPVKHVVRTWQGNREVAVSGATEVTVASLGTTTTRTRIAIPNASLWSPERPFLYTVESSTSGDRVATRFGMREFRFDTATRRAHLNGKPYFMRGSNITLHRFFEDPSCGRLPWDRAWVRKLLVDIPKKMHWNSFRFCIGPVPDFWMDYADEAGLLIQNEFFIWTGRDMPETWRQWDSNELIAEFKEYMRDNWNHPSQAIWDAANESEAGVLGDKIIPAVRGLDLSNRAWENGYNVPSGPDDPVEDHPYLFNKPAFQMSDLEKMTGARSTNSGHPSAHAAFINEYGWIWLNRDGTPTLLTENVYTRLLGADATPEKRFLYNAYWLAGLTEFWRAHRNFAGVLHFVYLTASFPGAYTSDHFRDVAKLELEPHFADYVSEAFKPLGVYINFWREELATGAPRTFDVMMVNDYGRALSGQLKLTLEAADGSVAASAERAFELNAAGAHTWRLTLNVPAREDDYTLKATATADQSVREPATVSRRMVRVARAAAAK
jgi:hypothetical protein